MSGGAAKTRRVKRDIDFAAPPVLVYCPKGSAGEGCVSFAGQLPQVHRKAVGKMRGWRRDVGWGMRDEGRGMRDETEEWKSYGDVMI